MVIHRDTNKKRNKTRECIWKDRNLDVKAEVLNILLNHDYYRYCDECIGSADDLFHYKLKTKGILEEIDSSLHHDIALLSILSNSELVSTSIFSQFNH